MEIPRGTLKKQSRKMENRVPNYTDTQTKGEATSCLHLT